MPRGKRKDTPEILQRTLDLCEFNSQNAVADIMKMPRATVQSRLHKAKRQGMVPVAVAKQEDWQVERLALKDQVRKLTSELKMKRGGEVTAEIIRETVLNLHKRSPDPPNWTLKFKKARGNIGIPVLNLSDLHWSEEVRPAQVNHVNEYGMDKGQSRLRYVVTTAIDLCKNHQQYSADYPGIVLVLGGDLLNGNIHEGAINNEVPVMVAFLDLQGCLIWAINKLEEHFGKVFVVSIPGNHPRNTIKPVFKNKNQTNFEWLLSCELESHYKVQGNKNVQFLVPDGPDAFFKIYNTQFLATHGDTLGVRGGDGIIGAIGPIKRGDVKVRTLSESLARPYDVLLLHHFHQHMNLGEKILVNGSLIGYNEYAMYSLRAQFEPPVQWLFFVHPTYNITHTWPIYAEPPIEKKRIRSFVSWPEEDGNEKSDSH